MHHGFPNPGSKMNRSSLRFVATRLKNNRPALAKSDLPSLENQGLGWYALTRPRRVHWDVSGDSWVEKGKTKHQPSSPGPCNDHPDSTNTLLKNLLQLFCQEGSSAFTQIL
jgi:hypothetical protein